jgi:hypothetical protein
MYYKKAGNSCKTTHVLLDGSKLLQNNTCILYKEVSQGAKLDEIKHTEYIMYHMLHNN